MKKGALCVGINDYDHFTALEGCVEDATKLSASLSRNDDGSPNFHIIQLLSSEMLVSESTLRSSVRELFSRKSLDVALFYFAGHGANTSSGSFLVSQDGIDDNEGIYMAEVIAAANESPAKERIIILDCCHSGAIDDLFGGSINIQLGTGVSVLAACRDSEMAMETADGGLFTEMLRAALDGGAADVRGKVSIANIYAYLDEIFGVWDQRPVFKANLEQLVNLRQNKPKVPEELLRKLCDPDFFKMPTTEHGLDPGYEPSLEPRDSNKEAIFSVLQQMRAASLVEPVDEDHLYFSAKNRGSCRLTPLGQFYWLVGRKGLL